MIGLWATVAVLTVATVAVLVLPLAGRTAAKRGGRADYDLAVFKDQLEEIERDRERGVLTDEQVETSRTEIERRILAASRQDDEDAVPSAPAEMPQWPLAAGLAVTLSVAAVALYLGVGSPDISGKPFAERPQATAASKVPSNIADMVKSLAARLEKEPGNIQGWTLLGRSYSVMGRHREAIEAYGRALELSDNDAGIATEMAEAMVEAAGGHVDAQTEDLFRRIMAADPLNPRARYYAALALAQNNDLAGAVQGWTDLLVLAPADAPWRDVVLRQRAQAAERAGIDLSTAEPSEAIRKLAENLPDAAPDSQESTASSEPRSGPTAEEMEEIARTTTRAEQSEMIRGMVQRLADRLKDNPNDLEGWKQLARAYDVLGEKAKADLARAKIKELSGAE